MKTVWLLGAGASASATKGKMPTMAGLSQFAFTREIYKRHSKDNEFGLLKEFVDHTVGKSITRGANVDFEKLLTNIEISYLRTEEARYLAARDSLVRLIKEIIETAESEITNCHEFAVLRLSLKEQDSLLTFNWDSLLDNMLAHAGKHEEHEVTKATSAYQEFLFNYTTQGSLTWKGAIGAPGFKSPVAGIYLKLHGSINWYTCPKQNCKNFGLVHVTGIKHAVLSCGDCGAAARPLIVPPTLNKNIDSNPLINKIWGRARNEIATANRIIIWGYSLPPTDFYSDWLLRQSGSSLSELVFINPEVQRGQNDTDLSRQYLDRFEHLTNHIEKQGGKIKGYLCYDDFCHDKNALLPKYSS